MTMSDPAERGGRLILWHGVPGTGKTTAARALGRAWSGWCRPHYVMDPERLFGEPRYLLRVAGVDEDEQDDDERWRLVIAEDCDEYLRAGASLGRLLNLCDGILGHGLRVLVLLTTNEDVGRLHPAITRPGRCLRQVEFEPLAPAEARAWLGAGSGAPEAPMTLAQLYALRESRPDGTAAERGLGGYL
jgi:SpoVK/Ycf46/Vps4 family AAA+-type ATPase